MKPIIGITSQFEHLVNRKMVRVNNTFVNAVVEGGGVPIILPILKDIEDIDSYLSRVDGLIFTGGEDVTPIYFGEEPIKEVDYICIDRDDMELELFKRAYEKNIPLLGICRGLQLFNIGLGGTLYQDIPRQIPNAIGHACGYNVHQGYHTINIEKDSILYDIFKKEKLVVNSQHHQSIKDLGENMRITSTTIDGVVESIESTNEKFLLGVQFHPEVMMNNDKEFIKFFSYFVERCK